MIRCACVSSYMGPYISNYILSEIALERKFRQQGDHLVHIFPKDVQDKEWVKLFEKEGAKLYFIEYHPNTLWTKRTLRQIFRKEQINIIHCHFGGWDIDARLAAPFTKMVWHQRMSVNLDTTARRIKYWIKYNVFGFYRTRHIAISNAVYEAISSITSKKTYFVPNAIDFNRLHPYENKPPYTEGAPCHILLFGYSPYVKGLDIAYSACSEVVRHGHNIHLCVVSQPVSDQYVKENINPMPSWFKVLPPSSNVSEYYNQADIFLSASRSEGFSNSLLEAIYCGCTAIYSDIPGTKWAAEFHDTYEYKVESAKDLSDKIIEHIKTRVSQEHLTSNRLLAHEKYSMNNWVKSIYNILTDFCKN